jgi:diaminopimelate decarboxylase
MSFFNYQNNRLYAESVSLEGVAEQFGTPCYVYSRAALETQWQTLDAAFANYPHLICFAVKANSNLAVLNVLASLGSGFDIVSGGELQRVLAAGGQAHNVVFSGVAKSRAEIELALLKGIRCINVESQAELQRVQNVAAELQMVAPIGVRVNPDVDAQTHPYIATGLKNSKFGIGMEDAFTTYLHAKTLPNIEIHSMACHIGSQIIQLSPFQDAVARVATLVNRLADQDIQLRQLDLGGGLGISYRDETPPSATNYIEVLLGELTKQGITLPVAIEPGRFIAGNAGVLLTRVEYLKRSEQKNFAIVDAGMNDLLRPSLYQAYHKISNVTLDSACQPACFDVVGPVCESADILGSNREICAQEGELLAIESAGAYANVMASNYNTRPRPAEVMVDGERAQLVREREQFDDLIRGESLLQSTPQS